MGDPTHDTRDLVGLNADLPKLPLPTTEIPQASSPSEQDPFATTLLPVIPRATAIVPHTPTTIDQASLPQTPTEEISPLTWLTRGLHTVLTSTETTTSIGNTLVSLDTWSGLLLHPICGVWSLCNQFRNKYLGNPASSSESLPQESSAPSYVDLTRKVLASPGVYRSTLTATFCISAIESLVRGNIFQSVAFGLMSTANAAAARLLNAGYWREDREPTRLERGLTWTWNQIPARLQSILANPAPTWCASDLMIGIAALNTTQLGSPLALISYGIAGAGVLYSVVPALFRKGFQEPSPTSLVLNGATNYSFAVCNFVFGNPLNAIALTLWGTTSMTFAFKRHKDNKLKNESSGTQTQ